MIKRLYTRFSRKLRSGGAAAAGHVIIIFNVRRSLLYTLYTYTYTARLVLIVCAEVQKNKIRFLYLRCAVCSRDRKRCKRVRRFGFFSTASWWTFCNSHSSSRLYGQPIARTVNQNKTIGLVLFYASFTILL